MNMQKNRQLLALLVTLTLVITPLVALGVYIHGEHQNAQAQLDKMEPRHARLLGLSSQQPDIAALLEQVNKAGEQYIYPASQDAAQAQANRRAHQPLPEKWRVWAPADHVIG